MPEKGRIKPARRTKSMDWCENQSASIKAWKKANPGEVKWFCFKCRLWRHQGECARHRCQQDFARLTQALARYTTDQMCLIVLTLSPTRETGDSDDSYRDLVKKWTVLQRRLTRTFGKFEFYTTVEAQRNGLPHMNVLTFSWELRWMLEWEPATGARAAGPVTLSPQWFNRMAKDAGFGHRSTLDAVKDMRAAASYVTKPTKGTFASPIVVGAEVSKTTQLPFNAPRRFRRIRTSKGFLEPMKRSGEWTGEFLTQPTPEIMLQRQAAGMAKLRDHLWPTSSTKSRTATAP